MLDEGRRRSMREYQQRRGAARREHGLVTRTAWIRSEDVEAFKNAIAPLVDHARIVEAVIGSVTVEPVEIIAIINKHKFPYDPQDIIFIMRFAETMALKPTEQAETCRRAEAIIQQYGFHLTVDDLI
jgi:uncharacterized Fe-S cluster-containing protein